MYLEAHFKYKKPIFYLWILFSLGGQSFCYWELKSGWLTAKLCRCNKVSRTLAKLPHSAKKLLHLTSTDRFSLFKIALHNYVRMQHTLFLVDFCLFVFYQSDTVWHHKSFAYFHNLPSRFFGSGLMPQREASQDRSVALRTNLPLASKKPWACGNVQH